MEELLEKRKAQREEEKELEALSRQKEELTADLEILKDLIVSTQLDTETFEAMKSGKIDELDLEELELEARERALAE